MKNGFASHLDNFTTWLFFLISGLIPLFFLNSTTDFFDFPKLILLSVSVVLIFGLLTFSWILKGKISLTRTPLDIPFLIFLSVIILSTLFSPSKLPSIFGNFPRVHGSAISWIIYILLYFISVSLLSNRNKIKSLLVFLYFSASVVGLIALMSLVGIFLPFDLARSLNFTPTGLPFSDSALMLLLLPLPFLSTVSVSRDFPKSFGVILSTVFGLVITLTGSVPDIVLLFITYSLCLAFAKIRQMKIHPAFLIPVVISIVSLLFAYTPFSGNRLARTESVFPREIQLPLSISWKITAGALRDSPLIGSGPGTYIFDFTAYKPPEFNLLKYWNFTFDTAYNAFIQILGTLGIIGFISLLYICFVVYKISRSNIYKPGELLLSLSISGLLAILLLLIHSTTLVSTFITVLIFAALMRSREGVSESDLKISLTEKSASGSAAFNLLPLLIFALYLVIAVPASYQIYRIFTADLYHRRALSQISTNGKLTYEYMQKAEALNPFIDLYRVDMAQINFALANSIASQKGPDASSPSGNLTDDEKRTIQTLLSQSITEARVSTTISPLSSRNWSVLGQIYRNIAGVAQNALTFSLDAYGRSIQRDPLNPILRLNVGGIYYSQKNYDSAIRFFTDAVNLKPDYANAYYNLAIALRDKGDVQSAVPIAQKAVSLLQQDVNFPSNPDYLKASDLVKELSSKNTSQNLSPAPAAQSESAFTNPQLPEINVTNLNNPPQVSTPAAVPQNPGAVLITPPPASVSNP